MEQDQRRPHALVAVVDAHALDVGEARWRRRVTGEEPFARDVGPHQRHGQDGEQAEQDDHGPTYCFLDNKPLDALSSNSAASLT